MKITASTLTLFNTFYPSAGRLLGLSILIGGLGIPGRRAARELKGKMDKTITKVQIEDSTLYHADCWDVFDEIGKVDIVITDPPYGIGENNKQNLSRGCLAKSTDYGFYDWDRQKINKKYTDKIISLSKNLIIFGGNYYSDRFFPSSGWIVWDKENRKTHFADCELIYTSFDKAVRKIKFNWNGMWQGDMKNKEKRVHPTQKPEYVMKWIIANYTKETDLVLDPFMGSGTTGVACAAGRRKFIGVEKEKRYFDIACERIEWAYRKLSLY